MNVDYDVTLRFVIESKDLMRHQPCAFYHLKHFFNIVLNLALLSRVKLENEDEDDFSRLTKLVRRQKVF